MADSRSHEHSKTDTLLGKKHARVLKAVFGINAAMFVIEGISGYLAHSTAMIADSLDMMEDAVGAGGSLLVRKRSPRRQAGVALAKAAGMGALGLGVLAGAALALLNPVVPVVATMAIVGGLALTANATCALLLYRYRNDNINMKSTWKCTRNDMFSNAGVLLAAAASHFLVSPIPDLIVGAAVSGLFIKSAISLARESIAVLRSPENAARKGGPDTHAAPRNPELKNVLGFRKILRAVFNRKAANTKKMVAPAVIDKPRNNKPNDLYV